MFAISIEELYFSTKLVSYKIKRLITDYYYTALLLIREHYIK